MKKSSPPLHIMSYTLRSAADKLGVDSGTLRREIARGTIPAKRFGNRIMIMAETMPIIEEAFSKGFWEPAKKRDVDMSHKRKLPKNPQVHTLPTKVSRIRIENSPASKRSIDPNIHFEKDLERRSRSYNLRGAAGSFTAREAINLLARQGGMCVYCDKLAHSFDHKIPIARGGGNDIDNIQWMCMAHNSSKGDLTDYEYRAALRKAGVKPRMNPI